MRYSRVNEIQTHSSDDYEILGRREVHDPRNGRIVIPIYDIREMGGRVLRPIIKNDKQ